MHGKDDENAQGVAIESGNEVAEKTIVGARSRRRRIYSMNIPAGVEMVLYRASVDRNFRSLLLRNRAAALAGRGIRLTPTESAVLNSVTDETLDRMIGHIRPKIHGRRKFMRIVAAAAVTLATGTAGMACDETAPVPVDTQEMTDMPSDSLDSLDASDPSPDIIIEAEDQVVTCDPVDIPLETEDIMGVEGIWPDVPDAWEEEEED